MRCVVTIEYNDGSVEEREHMGDTIDAVMQDFLVWNMNQTFEKEDKIHFKITEE